MLIGLTGVAQSGKDTAARALIEVLRFHRVAFADPLRNMVHAFNPWVFVPDNLVWDLFGGPSQIIDGLQSFIEVDYQFTHIGLYIRLRTLVDRYGWDVAKQVPNVREYLQRQGTEAGRMILGESIWVDTAMREVVKYKNVVITDVRFDNEAIAIRERGGFIVRIVRPGVLPVNGHVSDAGISEDLISRTLFNNDSIAELRRRMLRIYEEVLQEKAIAA